MRKASLQGKYTQKRGTIQPWLNCYRLFHFRTSDSSYICRRDLDCNRCGNKENCQRVQYEGCKNCKEPVCPRPFPDGETPSLPGRVSPSANLLQDIKSKGIWTVSCLIKDFQKYRDKLADTNVVVQYENRTMVISRKCTSRYHKEGRERSKKNIYRRLGSFHDSAVMVTLEYNPHEITQINAWASFNEHVSLFIKSLNQYLKRNNKKHGDKYKNIGFLRVVEQVPYYRKELDKDGLPIPNKSGGYPHIHIVFPGRRWLASIPEIERLWQYGMTQVKSFDNMNVVGYITKYVGKMEGWSDKALALIWYMRKRIYSYSRRYLLPDYREKQPGTWSYWGTLTNRGLKNVGGNQFPVTYIGVSPPN
jgi:hypothetical protein